MLVEQSHLEIMGEATEGVSFLEIVRNCSAAPLPVILDIFLPNVLRTENLSKVKSSRGDSDVLIFCMYEDIQWLHQALLNGAGGYLVKEKIDAELLEGRRQY